MKKLIGFVHELEIVDRFGEVVSRERVCNRVPKAALDFLIMAPFGDHAQIPNIYCGLFTKNYIPFGLMRGVILIVRPTSRCSMSGSYEPPP